MSTTKSVKLISFTPFACENRFKGWSPRNINNILLFAFHFSNIKSKLCVLKRLVGGKCMLNLRIFFFFFLGNSSMYILDNLSSKNDGSYRCSASNIYGTKTSHSFSLSVHCKFILFIICSFHDNKRRFKCKRWSFFQQNPSLNCPF